MNNNNFFKSTIDLFLKYYRKMDAEKVKGFNGELGGEVVNRLKQLQFLISEVNKLIDQSNKISEPKGNALQKHVEECKSKGIPHGSFPECPEAKFSKKEIQKINKIDFKLELYTECFYLIAGRLRTILRAKLKTKSKKFLVYFRGLSSFECEGARNVRNKLLIHPEGSDSQVFTISFGYGGPQGPVIKAVRKSNQKSIFPDKGLYKNAEEIKNNLEELLNNILLD